MKIRPYRIYSESQQSQLVQSVSPVLTAWAEDWMIAGYSLVGAEVMALAECSRAESSWLTSRFKDEPVLAIGYESGWLGQLRTLLLGDAIDSAQTTGAEAITQELSQAALRDLCRRVLQAAGLEQKYSPELTPGPLAYTPDLSGSAYIALNVRFPQVASMRLLMGPEAIDALLNTKTTGDKPPVTPRLRALDDERVVLEAIVGDGELTLDELRTLAAGDVIPLRRNVNQEIVLQIDSDTPVCVGFLGNAHGRLAVQLKSR